MNTYEYKTAIIKKESNMELELNYFGREGWELVSVISNPQLGGTKYNLVGISMNTVAVFKRNSNER